MAQSRTVKVLALSTGQGLTALVSLVAAAVLTRVLTVRDYATYRQTLLAYQFAAPLLTLSLPTALYYFMPGESKRRRGVLFDNLAALTVMGFVFAAFLLAGGDRLLAWRFKNPDLVGPLKWMAIYALFALPAGAIGACLTVQNRVVHLSAFNVISRALTLTAIIIAALVWQNPFAPIKANVVCEGIVLAFALGMMMRAVPHDDARMSLPGMFAMAKYAVPLGLASMFGTLTMQLDKMIVASMCSPEDFAIYANGAMEIPLIGIITGSIAAVILVDMRTAIAKENRQQALRLFQVAAVKAACILLPVMCLLFVFAEDVVGLLFSAKYLQSVVPFRLFLLMLPIRVVFYGSALMALGMTNVILSRSVLALILNALLSVGLVYVIGAWGAAVGTILTLYLFCLPVNLYYISKGFGSRFWEPLPLKKMSVILLASTLAALIPYVLFKGGMSAGSLRILFGSMVFVVTYVIASCLLKTEVHSMVLRWRRRMTVSAF